MMNVNFLGVMTAIYCSLRLMKENPGSLVFSTSSSSAMVSCWDSIAIGTIHFANDRSILFDLLVPRILGPQPSTAFESTRTYSTGNQYGMPGIATYSATKHAVKGLSEALSIELGSSFGIRVSDTLPGTINTPLMPTASAENAKKAPEKSPFRLIEPVEIAETVWKSWINDPEGKDALGDATFNRLHWYNPEELQVDIDSVVNTRGGAEKVRDQYREWLWKPMEARIKEAKEKAAAAASEGK